MGAGALAEALWPYVSNIRPAPEAAPIAQGEQGAWHCAGCETWHRGPKPASPAEPVAVNAEVAKNLAAWLRKLAPRAYAIGKLEIDLAMYFRSIAPLYALTAAKAPPAEPVSHNGHVEILRGMLSDDYPAPSFTMECEALTYAIESIAALTAAKAAQDGALSQIAGMEFYLHENPCDVADVEPARLVMAMSVGHQVFCHRASQGDNGICKPEVKAAPPESVKPCTDERACVNCYSGQGPCLIDGHAQPAPDGKGAAHG
jgi:hypothetical protein